MSTPPQIAPHPASPPVASGAVELTVMTYNVHACIGTDRRHSPERIAEVIAAAGADVVGLQELDVGRSRTSGIDQVAAVAELLGMYAEFHPAREVAAEKYGDAILSRLPLRRVKVGGLPSRREPRGAVWAEVTAGPASLQVINTHLGLSRGERAAQVARLFEADWLGGPLAAGKPLVLLGDFNAIPRSPAYRALTGRLGDAHDRGRAGRHPATFPSRYPLLRLDHILVAGPVEVRQTRVIGTTLARLASDHLPVVARLRLKGGVDAPSD